MSNPIARPMAALTAALLLAPVLLSAQVRLERPVGTGRTLLPPAPRAGPPPQNIGFDAQETFGVIAKVVWAPAANAASYVVKRRLLEDPACCNATSPVLTTTAWTDTGLLRKGTYMFTIVVNYADGSVGSAEFGVGAPGITNPVVSAQPNGTGKVRLTWNNNIAGTSGFFVTGPGMGTGKTVTSGQIDTPLLPIGTHTWSVASVYSQGLGVLGPGSSVSYNMVYGSGRFRISLERFKAISTTAEDPFRNDGKGDEVFITAQVNEYGPNGSLLQTRTVRTPTFGDTWNFPGRVRAGTASQTGGIQQNDEYPAAVQYISQLQPATTSNLPYLLWEGTLTQIHGVVIISPAIWESDGGDQLFGPYATFQVGAAGNLPYRTPFQSYVPWTLGNGVVDTWNPQKSCPAASQGIPSGRFVPPIQGWLDEPIDMDQSRTYCPTYVAINWAAANSMTTTNPAMVVEIPYASPMGWQYKLFLRIEKVN